jgi:hypothetical protein
MIETIYIRIKCIGFISEFQICNQSKSDCTLLNVRIIVRFERFHGSDYEEWCLLGCYAVWLL